MTERSKKQLAFNIKYPTQKQFGQIGLFKNVKLVNGDRAFRTIYKNCIIFDFQYAQRAPMFQKQQYFYLIQSGSLQIYKNQLKSQNLKGLIRSFKKDQYFGFQDFPLFIQQKLQIHVTSNTIVFAIKLDIFYQCFRRVLPLNSLQIKGEYLKKIKPFNNIEMEKLFRLVCFVQRRRCHSNSIVVQQKQEINNLIVIMEGRCEGIDQKSKTYISYGKHQIIGLQQTISGENYFRKQIICSYQCDVLLVPKDKFLKLYQIKSKLYQNLEKQTFLGINIQISELQNQQKDAIVENNYSIERTKTQGGYRVTKSYSLSNRNSNNKVAKFVTTQSNFSELQKNLNKNKHTMSEYHLKKFLNRKQKLESFAIFKYIKSKAPQLTLNPFKQFAMIPALHIKGSNYVKNFKRKIKKSISHSRNTQLIDS